MRASSLFAFSVLALVAPIAAAPQPLELYETEGTSTHIFHISTAVPTSIPTDFPYATAVLEVDSSGNVDIYKIGRTSTRTFHFGSGGSHVAHQTGSYKPVGTGSWHHHHATGKYSFVAGTGVVPVRTTSLSSYATPLLGSPKSSKAARDRYLTWTTGNSSRSSKVPGGKKPPLSSPSVSGEAEPNTETSSKASSATSIPSRQFKFKIGKPKRPRKKSCQGSLGGIVAKAQEDIDCVSEDAHKLGGHQSGTLQRDQYNENLNIAICGAPRTIWKDVLSDRVQELPNDTGKPNEDPIGSDEQESQYLTAPVPKYQLGYCSSHSSVPHPPLFSSLEDKYHGVLLMYDREFCVRPLTADCTINPFRCREHTSRGSRYLLHAIMALSSQLMSPSVEDKDSVAKTLNHKSAAIQLYREALSHSETRNLGLLDTLLILVTLEAAQSALSTWSVHIVGAYNLIEAAGGVKVLTMTPRLTSQVTMLLWWDITIALISRRGLIFHESYLDTILACANKAARPFFRLTGCPAELIVCMASLARLASAHEQSQGLKWTALKASHVDDLEAALTAWRNPYCTAGSVNDVQEDRNPAHDRYHCVEAWRNALILYVHQVFKRDLTIGSPAVISFYSRLILNHIRSITQETVIQKQVLLPLFLAGCEATEGNLRKQAQQFCRFWSQKNGYRMFQDVGDLLEHVWKDRRESADGRYWWGDTVDQYNTTGPTDPMRPQFLFG